MINIPDSIQELLRLFSFRGNTNLRPPGSVIDYTEEMLDEMAKCAADPVYFIKNYIYVVHPDKGICKMDLYDYQEKMVRAYHENKRVIFLTSRQQGKCLSLNTKVRLRQKSTQEVFEITLGEFYAWQKTFSRENLHLLQQAIYDAKSEGVQPEMSQHNDTQQNDC